VDFDFVWHEDSRMWHCGDIRIIEKKSPDKYYSVFSMALAKSTPETKMDGFDFYMYTPLETNVSKRANELLNHICSLGLVFWTGNVKRTPTAA